MFGFCYTQLYDVEQEVNEHMKITACINAGTSGVILFCHQIGNAEEIIVLLPAITITYNRIPKFNMEIIRKINSRKAAIEKES